MIEFDRVGWFELWALEFHWVAKWQKGMTSYLDKAELNKLSKIVIN